MPQKNFSSLIQSLRAIRRANLVAGIPKVSEPEVNRFDEKVRSRTSFDH
jgi:hypothetical protein